MDVQLCTYWANTIAEGVKTLADFEKALMKSSQYEKRVLCLLREKCAGLLGTSEALDAKMMHDLDVWQDGRIATSESVETFVMHSAPFRKKILDLINKTKTEVSDATEYLKPAKLVEAYVELFVKDKEYDHKRFAEDVGARRSYENVMQRLSSLPRIGRVQPDPLFSPHEKKVALPLGRVSDGTKRGSISDARVKSVAHNYDIRDVMESSDASILNNTRDVLDLFFEVYSRPMFVEEFLYYARDHYLANCTEITPWKQAFIEEKPVLHGLVNAVASMYSSYFPQRASQYDIIRRYMHMMKDEDVRTSNGLEKVKDRVGKVLISTEEYEKSMKENVERIHADIFGCNGNHLTDGDMDYVFGKLRNNYVSLMDKNLIIEFVREFRDEMDVITTEIGEIYMLIFGRVPDEDELNHHVTDYRSRRDLHKTKTMNIDDGDFATSSTKTVAPNEVRIIRGLIADVQHELIMGLEFQDVLKAKLKRMYLETVQVPLTSAQLYGILDKTLKEIRRMSDIPFSEPDCPTGRPLNLDKVHEISRKIVSTYKKG